MQAEWPIWRLVVDEKATLSEIAAAWSIDDVLDANEALDVAADLVALGNAVRGSGALEP